MITIPSAIASLLRFRLGLIKSGPLTNREIEKLDAFLLSDGGLENAMDVSTLDGFLCAVLSGPNVIMPSEWMRCVWDMEEGEQAPEFASETQAQRILGLLMVCIIATNVAPHEEVGGPACRRRDRCICNRFAHTRRCPEISMHFAPVADAQCTDRRLNNFQPRSSGAGFPRQIHF